jgi:hypothetical protein
MVDQIPVFVKNGIGLDEETPIRITNANKSLYKSLLGETKTSTNLANADIFRPKIPKTTRKIDIRDNSGSLNSFLSACIFKGDIKDSFSVKRSRSFCILWFFISAVKQTDFSNITSLIFGKSLECFLSNLCYLFTLFVISKVIENDCNTFLVSYSTNLNVRFTRNATQRTVVELFITLGSEPPVYFLKNQNNIQILSKFKNIER